MTSSSFRSPASRPRRAGSFVVTGVVYRFGMSVAEFRPSTGSGRRRRTVQEGGFAGGSLEGYWGKALPDAPAAVDYQVVAGYPAAGV